MWIVQTYPIPRQFGGEEFVYLLRSGLAVRHRVQAWNDSWPSEARTRRAKPMTQALLNQHLRTVRQEYLHTGRRREYRVRRPAIGERVIAQAGEAIVEAQCLSAWGRRDSALEPVREVTPLGP